MDVADQPPMPAAIDAPESTEHPKVDDQMAPVTAETSDASPASIKENVEAHAGADDGQHDLASDVKAPEPPETTRADILQEVQSLKRALRERLQTLDSLGSIVDSSATDQLSDQDSDSIQSSTDTDANSVDDKAVRKQIRRARYARRLADKIEMQTAADRVANPNPQVNPQRLARAGRLLYRYGRYKNADSANQLDAWQKYDVPNSALETDTYMDLLRAGKAKGGPSLPTGLRPIYSRKLGPPTQWDTSDSDEWSSDTSTKTQDFDYFRARLRSDFEWELDRLAAQRERYGKHKNKRQENYRKAAEADYAAQLSGSQDTRRQAPTTSKDVEVENPPEVRLRSLPWVVFRGQRFVRNSVNIGPITILSGDPEVSADLSWTANSTQRRTTSKIGDLIAIDESMASLSDQFTGQEPLPERIRIHSRSIMKFLSLVQSRELEGRNSDDHSTFIMLRPFKMLFHYRKELQRQYEYREKELQSPKDELQEELTPRQFAARVVENSGLSKPRDGRINPITDLHNYCSSETGLRHLGLLLEFINGYIIRKIAYLNSPDCEKITFSDLWYLFRPGDFVISKSGKQAYRVISITSAPHRARPQGVMYTKGPEGDTRKMTSESPIRVCCSYIHFDGKTIGPVVRWFDFDHFEGERFITSFDVYPIRFHSKKLPSQPAGGLRAKGDGEVATTTEEDIAAKTNEIRNALIQRGKKFVDVVGIKHMYYSGYTINTRDEVESLVVIDFEEAFSIEENDKWEPYIRPLIGPNATLDVVSRHGDKPCLDGCCDNENIIDDAFVEKEQHMEFIRDMLAQVDGNSSKLPTAAIYPRSLDQARADGNGFTDDEYLIMSYSVWGFILRDRTWAQLDLAYLTEVTTLRESNEAGDNAVGAGGTAFDRLVLDIKIKDMVLSLIAQHFRNKQFQQAQDEQVDIIRGKGKGLIILLHGAPGVGKTTTAEGVAEKFKKPLFRITCGDLGSDAKEVESKLSTNFALASRWGCILLLDEADVFLASRRRDDFTRNGLVAVFLRVLEYYAGILFLTTNRIGDFDEAFASRIHMSLYYPPLDEDATSRIFQLNFGMIRKRYQRNNREILIDEVDIIRFATKYWREKDQARWNGRQIRNACQTALALAEFEALPKEKRFDLTYQSKDTIHLKQSNIEVVSDAYLEFMNYLKAVHGVDPETRAKEMGVRAIERVFEALMDERFAKSRQAAQTGSHYMPAGESSPLRGYRIPTTSRGQPAPQGYEQQYASPYRATGDMYQGRGRSVGDGYPSQGHVYQPENPHLTPPRAGGAGQYQYPPNNRFDQPPPDEYGMDGGVQQSRYPAQGHGFATQSDPRMAQEADPEYRRRPFGGYPSPGRESMGVNAASIQVDYVAGEPDAQGGGPSQASNG